MWLLAFLFFASLGAHADVATESTRPKASTQLEGVPHFNNSVEGDLDKDVTDPKLRADSGSKSRYSLSASLTYTGGSLAQPFGAERPDLRGLPENQTDSSLDTALRVRYRTSKNVSYTGGVSLSVKTPLQGNVEGINPLSVGDPVLTRNQTFAALGLQHSWNVRAAIATSLESLRVDQVVSVATDYTMMKVYQNGLHVGLTVTSWYNFFSTKPGENNYTALTPGSPTPDNRTQWELTLFPTLEYYFTDKVSFRTLFGTFSWRHLYGAADPWSMSLLKPYQSIGFGISVTRDIYLYPNVQFLPQDMRSNFTNVGISSTLNVF